MRTGIFGGSFNPIHNGHILLAKTYAKALKLDRILVIPAHIPPHKSSEGLIDGAHRLRMCELAFDRCPFYQVSDMELRRPEKSYTLHTLQQLQERWPEDSFYLIMGSDMFLSFTTWFDWQQLLQQTVLCAGGREQGLWTRLMDQKQKLEMLGGCCELVKTDPVVISSTEIRRRVAQGISIRGLVPLEVANYIKKYGLYRQGA